MTFSRLPVLALLGLAACSTPASPADEGTAAEDELSSARGKECVVDTVTVGKGLLADVKAAFGAGYLKDYGANYFPHVEIPGVFDAAISSDDEFGEWFYTVVGFSYQAETLPSGSTAKPRQLAALSASPVSDSVLKTAKRNYAAVKSIFDAMTRADESVEDHVVPAGHVYDRAWTKTTRKSPAGRLVCRSTVYPDRGATSAADYECTFFGVESNHVQIHNTTGTGGKCLAK
jgi:hypothetical protein